MPQKGPRVVHSPSAHLLAAILIVIISLTIRDADGLGLRSSYSTSYSTSSSPRLHQPAFNVTSRCGEGSSERECYNLLKLVSARAHCLRFESPFIHLRSLSPLRRETFVRNSFSLQLKRNHRINHQFSLLLSGKRLVWAAKRKSHFAVPLFSSSLLFREKPFEASFVRAFVTRRFSDAFKLDLSISRLIAL